MNIVIAANLPFSDQVRGFTGVEYPSHMILKGRSAASRMITSLRKALDTFGLSAESSKFEALSGEPVTALVLGPGQEAPADLPENTQIHRVAPTDAKGGMKVLETLPGKGWTLFASADSVLMSSQDTLNFLRDCSAYSTDIMVPLVSKDNFRNSFPEVEKHFFKLVEGKFALGRAFIARTESARRGAHKASGMAELAEDPIALAKSMGVKLSMKYALGRLSMEDVEKFADSHLEVNSKFVVTSGSTLGLAATTVQRVVTAQRLLDSCQE